MRHLPSFGLSALSLLLVTDHSTAGAIRAKLCFTDLDGSVSCSGEGSTTVNSSHLDLYATPPTGWSNDQAAAYLQITLPPFGQSYGSIHGYVVYTH